MAIGKFTTAVQAAKAIKSMLPDSVYEDMKKYVETQVQSVISNMKLVRREEFDEQGKKLKSLTDRIEALEQLETRSVQQAKNKN